MPAVYAKMYVPPLKVLVSMVISLNKAQETVCLFKSYFHPLNGHELNGYNSRQCRETGQYVDMKTKLSRDM